MPVIQMREALNQAMSEEMERDETVFLMGEEVGYYNGAYKVSQGMLKRFGEKRVIDAPIVENGFAGLGIGAAMVGLRPIIEFMTWNFSLVAADQLINNAAKIRQMSGGQFKCPIVFRGPGGPAHQLGAQHSQALEHIWVNVPGLKVVAPSVPYDAKGLLKASIRDENPIVFIEGEVAYADTGEVPEGEYTIPLGVGDIKREGSDCTIIAWSKMIKVAMAGAEALAAEGIEAEVLDPRTLRPLDEELIVQSVKKTGRVIILEEGWPFNGVGAEIAYRIQRRCFDDLDHPVERLTSMDVSAPYHREVEKSIRPTPEKTAALVKKVLYLE
jgi:pyruvate dehydrogenase E1 component beta subunit